MLELHMNTNLTEIITLKLSETFVEIKIIYKM